MSQRDRLVKARCGGLCQSLFFSGLNFQSLLFFLYLRGTSLFSLNSEGIGKGTLITRTCVSLTLSLKFNTFKSYDSSHCEHQSQGPGIHPCLTSSIEVEEEAAHLSLITASE